MTGHDPFRARPVLRLPLRDRLLALRRSALSRLAAAGRIDDGELMRWVADSSAALDALKAEAAEAVEPVPGGRAVVIDEICKFIL